MARADKFLEAIEEISVANGTNWNDDYKLTLMARFLEDEGVSFKRFEDFMERQATEEAGEPDCAHCGEEVAQADAESTFCGTMHRDCLFDHAHECGVCKNDFIQSGRINEGDIDDEEDEDDGDEEDEAE